MSRNRITYYRGMIIVSDGNPNGEGESYRIIINGIKSAVALISIQAAQNLIDTYLKNKAK